MLEIVNIAIDDANEQFHIGPLLVHLMLFSSHCLALGYYLQQFFPEVDDFIDFIPDELLHFLPPQLPHAIDEDYKVIKITSSVFF